jgi:hypothetical protein
MYVNASTKSILLPKAVLLLYFDISTVQMLTKLHRHELELQVPVAVKVSEIQLKILAFLASKEKGEVKW